MSELAELLKRVEAATGPDREIDELLTAWSVGAVREEDATFDHKPAYHRDGFWVSIGPIAPYTASIDAAVSLIEKRLPGWAWLVDWIGMPDQPACHAEVWLPGYRSQHLGRERWRGEAPTPALALLRALLHEGQG